MMAEYVRWPRYCSSCRKPIGDSCARLCDDCQAIEDYPLSFESLIIPAIATTVLVFFMAFLLSLMGVE